MTTCPSTLRRLCVVALLLLVASPVTAPFSTVDLVALLTGTTAQGVASQSKIATDDAVVCVAAGLDLRTPSGRLTRAEVARSRCCSWDGAFDIPLRI